MFHHSPAGPNLKALLCATVISCSEESHHHSDKRMDGLFLDSLNEGGELVRSRSLYSFGFTMGSRHGNVASFHPHLVMIGGFP